MGLIIFSFSVVATCSFWSVKIIETILDAIRNDLSEFVVFRRFKSHIVVFGQYLFSRVLDDDLYSFIRSEISNLGW